MEIRKVGIVAHRNYSDVNKIMLYIHKLKATFGPTLTINSGGSDSNAEKSIKKHSLECNFKYKEYNPSFTGYKMFSAMPENYYGKNYHVSHLFDRFKHLLFNSDIIVFFVEDKVEDPALDYLFTQAKKKNIKVVVIK